MCVKLSNVLMAIVDHAFASSEYPVILSMYIHSCGQEDLKIIAALLVDVLGDSIATWTFLCSPESLKRKFILCLTSYPETADSLWSVREADGKFMSICEQASPKDIPPKHPDLIRHCDHFHLYSSHLKMQFPCFAHIVSESPISVCDEAVDPIAMWDDGCQIVTVYNSLRQEKHGGNQHLLELNRAMFRRNKNCGYVLKQKERLDKRDVYIEVISAQQLPKRHGKLMIDPFVEIILSSGMSGGAPTRFSKQSTKPISSNGLQPTWKEELRFSLSKESELEFFT